MDRGATRELVVSGMSRTNLVAALEGAAVQKGFRIVKKEYFHDSTLISAEKGSLLGAVAADIVTDGLSGYAQSGNAYGMDVEVTERGGRLRMYFAVYPRTLVYEQGEFLGLIDRPLLNLTLDPTSNRLLEDVLDKMKARGIVLEPLQIYQDTIGLKPGEKTVDDSGWTVQRSQTVQIGASSTYDYKFWGMVSGIIGLVGSFILIGGFLLGRASGANEILAFLCIGFFLSLFGFLGVALSIPAVVKSGKGKRSMAIVALVLSGIPVLTLIIVVVLLFLGVMAYLSQF